MPPRRQPQRQAQAASSFLDPQVIAKRTKRHLDELEKSNYAEPSNTLAGAEEDEDTVGGRSLKGKARQVVISDKREWPGMPKKKSGHNVRTAVLYKKNLEKLIEESGIATLSPEVPTYLRATAPPPREPPQLLCSVCGYWGKYKCRKCAMPYCDFNCNNVHNETRCERRVI